MKGYLRNLKKLYSKGIINRGLKRLGINKYTVDERQFKDDEEQLNFESLREINVLIARLEMDREETLGLLVGLCKKCGLSRGNMEKLVRYQYLSRRNEVDKENARAIKKRREEKLSELTPAIKLLKAVKLAIRFLPAKQAFRLMLVSRAWKEALTLPIFRRYLQFEPVLTMATRLRLYSSFVPKKLSPEIYNKMLKEMSGDHHPFSEVINLDVRRSLASRP